MLKFIKLFLVSLGKNIVFHFLFFTTTHFFCVFQGLSLAILLIPWQVKKNCQIIRHMVIYLCKAVPFFKIFILLKFDNHYCFHCLPCIQNSILSVSNSLYDRNNFPFHISLYCHDTLKFSTSLLLRYNNNHFYHIHPKPPTSVAATIFLCQDNYLPPNTLPLMTPPPSLSQIHKPTDNQLGDHYNQFSILGLFWDD